MFQCISNQTIRKIRENERNLIFEEKITVYALVMMKDKNPQTQEAQDILNKVKKKIIKTCIENIKCKEMVQEKEVIFLKNCFIYLFGCIGFQLWHMVPSHDLQDLLMQHVHSSCSARAQQLWHPGFAALWHMGS